MYASAIVIIAKIQIKFITYWCIYIHWYIFVTHRFHVIAISLWASSSSLDSILSRGRNLRHSSHVVAYQTSRARESTCNWIVSKSCQHVVLVCFTPWQLYIEQHICTRVIRVLRQNSLSVYSMLFVGNLLREKHIRTTFRQLFETFQLNFLMRHQVSD